MEEDSLVRFYIYRCIAASLSEQTEVEYFKQNRIGWTATKKSR